MGSPCLFTRQQSLKLGYFYWLSLWPLFVLFALMERTAAIMDVAMLCAVKRAQCKTRELPQEIKLRKNMVISKTKPAKKRSHTL